MVYISRCPHPSQSAGAVSYTHLLSIQYFNQVINAKPYLYEPYFFRALAKLNLEDFQGAETDCDAAVSYTHLKDSFYL